MMRRFVIGAALSAAMLAQAGGAARANELPFEPGEELRLSVRYLKMNVGDVQITVGANEQPGTQVWPLAMKAKTKGFFNAMYSVDETFVSHFDVTNRRSLGTDLNARLDGEPSSEQVRIDGTSAQVRRVKKTGTSEQTHEVLPNTHDVLSAVYYLRSLPLSDQAEFSIPVFTGKKSWEMTGRVVGRETIDTDLGRFDTIKVLCRTHFDGKFASDRDLTVWLSADERRLPLRIDADFMVGTMKATLQEYRRGTVAQNEQAKQRTAKP